MSRTTPRSLVASIVLLAVAGAACDSDDASETAAAEPTGGSEETDADADADADGDAEAPPETVITDGELVEGGATTTVPGSTKPDVVVPDELPTELVITDLVAGQGPAAAEGDTVIVDYVGVRTEDGTEFDNSYDRGIPFDVLLGQGRVIAGWDQGLVGVQTGGTRQLDIPADLAYGDNPQGGVIQPGDALTFVVEVRAVIPAADPSDAPLDVEVEASVGATDVTTVDVVEGEGAVVEEGQTAVTHLLLVRGDNEVVLYNTWEQQEPIQIILAEGGSLPGLVEGIPGMRVGGTRVISMPPGAAFGEQGDAQLGLPAGTDLIVVVELLGAY